jgi:nitroreductase
VCSFDKGFHSKDNQAALKEMLDLAVLPRKGKLRKQARQEERAEPFVKARNAHSAVESAINALEVYGLDVCPDHGIDGFEPLSGIGSDEPQYPPYWVALRGARTLSASSAKPDMANQTSPTNSQRNQRRADSHFRVPNSQSPVQAWAQLDKIQDR